MAMDAARAAARATSSVSLPRSSTRAGAPRAIQGVSSGGVRADLRRVRPRHDQSVELRRVPRVRGHRRRRRVYEQQPRAPRGGTPARPVLRAHALGAQRPPLARTSAVGSSGHKS